MNKKQELARLNEDCNRLLAKYQDFTIINNDLNKIKKQIDKIEGNFFKEIFLSKEKNAIEKSLLKIKQLNGTLDELLDFYQRLEVLGNKLFKDIESLKSKQNKNFKLDLSWDNAWPINNIKSKKTRIAEVNNEQKALQRKSSLNILHNNLKIADRSFKLFTEVESTYKIFANSADFQQKTKQIDEHLKLWVSQFWPKIVDEKSDTEEFNAWEKKLQDLLAPFKQEINRDVNTESKSLDLLLQELDQWRAKHFSRENREDNKNHFFLSLSQFEKEISQSYAKIIHLKNNGVWLKDDFDNNQQAINQLLIRINQTAETDRKKLLAELTNAFDYLKVLVEDNYAEVFEKIKLLEDNITNNTMRHKDWVQDYFILEDRLHQLAKTNHTDFYNKYEENLDMLIKQADAISNDELPEGERAELDEIKKSLSVEVNLDDTNAIIKELRQNEKIETKLIHLIQLVDQNRQKDSEQINRLNQRMKKIKYYFDFFKQQDLKRYNSYSKNIVSFKEEYESNLKNVQIDISKLIKMTQPVNESEVESESESESDNQNNQTINTENHFIDRRMFLEETNKRFSSLEVEFQKELKRVSDYILEILLKDKKYIIDKFPRDIELPKTPKPGFKPEPKSESKPDLKQSYEFFQKVLGYQDVIDAKYQFCTENIYDTFKQKQNSFVQLETKCTNAKDKKTFNQLQKGFQIINKFFDSFKEGESIEHKRFDKLLNFLEKVKVFDLSINKEKYDQINRKKVIEQRLESLFLEPVEKYLSKELSNHLQSLAAGLDITPLESANFNKQLKLCEDLLKNFEKHIYQVLSRQVSYQKEKLKNETNKTDEMIKLLDLLEKNPYQLPNNQVREELDYLSEEV